MEQEKPVELEWDFDVLYAAIKGIKPQRHGLLCPFSTFEKEKICNCGYEDAAAFYEKAREAIERIKSETSRLKGQAEAVGKLVEAAKAFCEQLKLIHGDPKYLGVWQISQIHVGSYTGPQYEKEFEDLCAALSNLEASKGPEVTP